MTTTTYDDLSSRLTALGYRLAPEDRQELSAIVSGLLALVATANACLDADS